MALELAPNVIASVGHNTVVPLLKSSHNLKNKKIDRKNFQKKREGGGVPGFMRYKSHIMFLHHKKGMDCREYCSPVSI